MILPNSRPFEAILPEDIDPNFLQFIKSCLKWRPMTRITAEEGLNHNFITGEEETPAARRRRERRARRAELAKNNEK